ncbi:hypothetical protein GC093_10080 [Paenibacillus sp. LMG 31456]|uniref:Uncharacterized protein n=1 Tax=Paenibacillus foliorum TaxID=2654974 RepID=A0A972K083_9BACL|nr:hypothetical protein [Paenibacillus foliorum]NOU93565.1 hypothetical protein [Paenibacillus foliorum]
MLTFQEKLSIIESFTELQRHNVSLGRVNFHYENSCYDKKNVVYHLHPNGNGFVYAGYLKGYQKDDKDMVNIWEYSAEDLQKLIQASIDSLTGEPAAEKVNIPKPSPEKQTSQRWMSSDNQILTLILEEDLWNLYFGLNLESAFETYEEAEEYLQEEGFTRM